MLPIIDEIISLGKYGLIVKKPCGEEIKSKVHLVMATGDIPQVSWIELIKERRVVN